MKIFAYKMTHDDGAAPCVQDGLLTLAICKPTIRKAAQKGNFIVGIGGENLGIGRLIYVAEVSEVIKGRNYYETHRDRLDCVYEPDSTTGLPVHRGEDFDHQDPVFKPRDVGCNWENAFVLKSTNFRYLGIKGPGYLDLLVYYDDLRSLVEMHRTNLPDTKARCLIIDSQRIEWNQLNEVIRELWKNFESVPGELATHYEDDPRPHEWLAHNTEVQKWRDANQFNAQKFGFRLRDHKPFQLTHF
jgi:hypothetical protein